MVWLKYLDNMSNIIASLNLSKAQLKKLAKAAQQAAEETEDEETLSEVEYYDYEFETDSEEEDTDSDDEDTDSEDEDTDSEDEDTDSEDEDTDSEDEDTDSEDEDTDSEEEDTDSEEEDEDDEDRKYTRKELQDKKAFGKGDLQNICTRRGLKKSGTKEELIDRILKSQRKSSPKKAPPKKKAPAKKEAPPKNRTSKLSKKEEKALDQAYIDLKEAKPTQKKKFTRAQCIIKSNVLGNIIIPPTNWNLQKLRQLEAQIQSQTAFFGGRANNGKLCKKW